MSCSELFFFIHWGGWLDEHKLQGKGGRVNKEGNVIFENNNDIFFVRYLILIEMIRSKVDLRWKLNSQERTI